MLTGGGASFGFNIAYEGLKETSDALKNFANVWAGLPGTVVVEVFMEAASIARQEAPYLTGNLRNNIFAEQTGTQGAALHSMAPYSGFVNFGHRTRGGSGFVPPQPFFTAAMHFIEQELLPRMTEALSRQGFSGSTSAGFGGSVLGG